DFTFIGKVSRTVVLAHETSAYARRAGRLRSMVVRRCPAAPGVTSAREIPRRGRKHMRSFGVHLQKKAARSIIDGAGVGSHPLPRRRPDPAGLRQGGGRAGA